MHNNKSNKDSNIYIQTNTIFLDGSYGSIEKNETDSIKSNNNINKINFGNNKISNNSNDFFFSENNFFPYHYENDDLNIQFKLKKQNDLNHNLYFKEMKLNYYESNFNNLLYFNPKISKDLIYFGLIGRNKNNNDILYIWNLKNIYKPLYSIKTYSIILNFDFLKNNNFIIIDKNKEPILYDINDGKKLMIFDFVQQFKECLNTYYNEIQNFYAYFTEKDITIWDTNEGKIIHYSEDDSKFKYMKNNKYISIIYNNTLNINSLLNEESVNITIELSNINNVSEIFSLCLNESENSIYYIIKEGIFNLNIENNKITQIINFLPNNSIKFKKAMICSNCNIFIITDYKNIYCYNKNKKLFNISKTKFFESININFDENNNSTLMTLDNYHVNLRKLDFSNTDLNISQKDIYFLKKYYSILFYKFSYDYSILIIVFEEDVVCIWDTKSGNITSIWYIPNIPNMCKSVSITSNKCQYTLISIKEEENLINIFNYCERKLFLSIKGFNAYNCKFSNDGEYLLIGTKQGNEICRLYNLNDINKYKAFKYNKPNINTSVCFLDNLNIICISENQNPLLFNINNCQLIEEYNNIQCNFDYIHEIKISSNKQYFQIYGRNENKNIAIFYNYKMKDYIILNNFNNINFSKNSNLVLIKNNFKNLLYYIKDNNLKEVNINKFKTLFNYSDIKFLKNTKCLYCTLNYLYKSDIITKIIIININSFKIIGEIQVTKKNKILLDIYKNKKSEFYLNNEENNKLILIKFIFNN
jgi:hypothetical protein